MKRLYEFFSQYGLGISFLLLLLHSSITGVGTTFLYPQPNIVSHVGQSLGVLALISGAMYALAIQKMREYLDDDSRFVEDLRGLHKNRWRRFLWYRPEGSPMELPTLLGWGAILLFSIVAPTFLGVWYWLEATETLWFYWVLAVVMVIITPWTVLDYGRLIYRFYKWRSTVR